MTKQCRNHNIRFSMGDDAAVQAWERLHSAEVEKDFKSKNAFVVAAINDYYERHLAEQNDPYLESREKEDAFTDRIVEAVEKKVLANIPALIGNVVMASEMNLTVGAFEMTSTGTQVAEVPPKIGKTAEENLLPEETYEDNPEKPAHDIIAADDGEITEMITRSGTPVVTVGTKVKKGDVLVNGCIEILNDDGEVAKYLYRTADADVTAKVTYPYHDEIPVTYVEKKPTGAKKITYQIRMLDYLVKIPFFSPMEEPYEVVSDVSQFHFTDNFYLPVYLVRQTYSGYENRQKTYTEKEAKQLASKNLKKYINDLEEKGIQITGKNVIIERTKKKYVVKGTISTIKSIVSYQPTKIIEQSSEERQLTDESD